MRQLKGKKDHKERREFVIDNGEAIIADAHALLLAQNSWFIYTALRVAHLANAASKDERDAALLEKLVADARSDYAATTEMTWLLLTALANEFGVIAELEGKRTFVVGGQKRAARQVYMMVEQLLSALEAAIGREGLGQRPAPKLPQTSVFEKGAPKELLSVLRFRLGHEEQVLAAADVTCDLWRWDVRDAGWAVLTDERLLVTKQDTFRRLGTIDVAVPVEDVRFVRVERRRDKGAKLHVATKDANFEIVFRDWAARGRRKDSAQQFADAVASFMNLPADEIPPRPQLARSSTDLQGLPQAAAGPAVGGEANGDTSEDPGQPS